MDGMTAASEAVVWVIAAKVTMAEVIQASTRLDSMANF
jgi:hypothetical protein